MFRGKVCFEHRMGFLGTCRLQLAVPGRQNVTSPKCIQCASHVVVVESPAKAKKIQGYLGADYKVIASNGHIRDISTKPGSICPEEWSRIQWRKLHSGSEQLKKIENLAKASSKLILATDPDREGEAISWHILEELKGKGCLTSTKVERITFSEVTKQAVMHALENPRQVSDDLVNAYLARRALDYQVGFTLSPVLWRKLPGVKSAGRVQSVALRFVCDREREIANFVPEEYWSVEVMLDSPHGKFPANLTHLNNKRLGKFGIGDEAAAQKAVRNIEAASLKVESVDTKTVKRVPPPPFTTSTLQQEALHKLGFSPAKTIRVAQNLYTGENFQGEGLITYVRTDSVFISNEAVTKIRQAIEAQFSKQYLPRKARHYKSKAMNSQEAHEAIRPTNPSLLPSQLSPGTRDEQRLYGLIWRRAVASQMADACILQVAVDVSDEFRDVVLHSSDSQVTFDGFLKCYQPSEDDALTWKASHGDVLVVLKDDDPVSLDSIRPDQHFTAPPPRYTEASLIKALEANGIGRPSTYAPILELLLERGYVTKNGRSLSAAGKGQVLTAFLLKHFGKYVDYNFTSMMETQLDLVAHGSESWRDVMDEFWHPFSAQVNEVSEKATVSSVVNDIDELLCGSFFPPQTDGSDPRKCPQCANGLLGFKPSKTGGFIGCSNYNLTGCTYSRPLEANGSDSQDFAENGSELGVDPRTGGTVFLKNGRFGRYLHVVPCAGSKYKLKNIGIPKSQGKKAITLETALAVLDPLAEVGFHPDDGDVIEIRPSRFGNPYLYHGKSFVKLPKELKPTDVDMEIALQLLSKAGNVKKASATKNKPATAKKEPIPRSRTAYNVFCSQEGKTLRQRNPELSPTQVMRELGRRWRGLNDVDKAPYVQMAVEEKSRLAGSETEEVNGGQVHSSSAKKKAPRRKTNGYIAYTMERRPLLQKENPSSTFGELSKRLGELWRELDDSEKERYRKMANSGQDK